MVLSTLGGLPQHPLNLRLWVCIMIWMQYMMLRGPAYTAFMRKLENRWLTLDTEQRTMLATDGNLGLF